MGGNRDWLPMMPRLKARANEISCQRPHCQVYRLARTVAVSKGYHGMSLRRGRRRGNKHPTVNNRGRVARGPRLAADPVQILQHILSLDLWQSECMLSRVSLRVIYPFSLLPVLYTQLCFGEVSHPLAQMGPALTIYAENHNTKGSDLHSRCCRSLATTAWPTHCTRSHSYGHVRPQYSLPKPTFFLRIRPAALHCSFH